MPARIAMYNSNALKIGVFGANCSSGRSATTVPERWSASWPDCLRLARMAEDAGIDFMLPIARWKGYGGDTDFHGATLETVTWAAGLRRRPRVVVPPRTDRSFVSHALVKEDYTVGLYCNKNLIVASPRLETKPPRRAGRFGPG